MTEVPGEAQVREVLAAYQQEATILPSDADLIDSRLITSLQFITAIQGLIDASGREPDLDAIPVERLRTISGLAEIFFARDARAGELHA